MGILELIKLAEAGITLAQHVAANIAAARAAANETDLAKLNAVAAELAASNRALAVEVDKALRG